MHRNCSRLWLELLELFYYKYIYEFCQSDGGLSFLSVFVFKVYSGGQLVAPIPVLVACHLIYICSIIALYCYSCCGE